MNATEPSRAILPGAGWQILGELELPAGSNAEVAIHLWLVQILQPLHLHADFLHKILKSAQEAALRAFQTEAASKFDHIHLLIFVPPEPASNEKTWGFFRIEKSEAQAGVPATAAHAIEFYLYMEGLEDTRLTS